MEVAHCWSAYPQGPRWSQSELASLKQKEKATKIILKNKKAYNSRYSLVVTHPTTNLQISSIKLRCWFVQEQGPILLSLPFEYINYYARA
jgi:hypothetical protein